MTTYTIKLESSGKVLLLTPCTEIITLSNLFQNTFILRRPRVVIIADILNIATMFTECRKGF